MTLKKLMAILLALALCFSLFACGDSDDDDDDDRGSGKHSSSKKEEDEDKDKGKDKDKENNNWESETDEPEETEPNFPEIDMDGVNSFANGIEFSFVRAYHTAEVKSPDPMGRGLTFDATDGKVWMVLHLNVTNTTDEAMSISDLFGAFFVFGEKDGTGTYIVAVEPDTNKLTRSYQLGAGETVLIYYMARWADTYDLSGVTVSIESGEEVYQSKIDFSQEFSYKIEAPKFSKGDTFTSDFKGNFSVTVADVYMSEDLYPPQATGNYTYWGDQEGEQYLIVKLNVKNLADEDLSYYNIAGVFCKHNGTEKYDAFFVTEEDGGQNLSLGGGMMAPQEENVMYFVMGIPDEIVGEPLEITMYVGKDMYICNFAG